MAPRPNFEKFKVDELKKQCKEVGLPTSGNKHQLIERLDEYYSDECFSSFKNGSQLEQRLHALEKSLSELQNNGFQPAVVSSPNEAATTDSDTIPQSTHVNICSPVSSIPLFAQSYVNEKQPPNVSLPYSAEPSTATIYQQTLASPFSRVTAAYVSSAVPSTRPADAFTYTTTGAAIAPPYNSTTGATVAPPFNPMPSATIAPPYYSRTCANVAPPYNTITGMIPTINPTNSVYVTQPTVHPIHYPPYNPYNSAREIAALLPEFNPSLETSLNSQQFIRRIDNLKQAYLWDDNTVFTLKVKTRF